MARMLGPAGVVFMSISVLLGAATGADKVALVTVVADANGPIRDLTAKDFVVKEDNATREVTGAELSTDPMSIVLLVDTARPPIGVTPQTQDLRTALSAFVNTVQKGSPGTQIALGEFAGASVTRVDFTAQTADLDKAILRLVPSPQVTAVLLEALVDAGKKLKDRPAPRRAIVSVDYNSQETSAERTMKDAVQSVHDAGATLWTVSVRGTGTAFPSREDTLNKLAKANGGMRLFSQDSSGLANQLKVIANTLLSQYTVTFVRPGGNPKSTVMETKRGATVLLSPWMR